MWGNLNEHTVTSFDYRQFIDTDKGKPLSSFMDCVNSVFSQHLVHNVLSCMFDFSFAGFAPGYVK